MIKSVKFLSQAEAKALPANSEVALISITNPDEPPVPLSECHSILRVAFDDMAEDWLSLPTQQVPENTRDGKPVTWLLAPMPMFDDAVEIVTFIKQLASSSDELDLVVHCHAGISRSAAVALFVAAQLEVPFAMEKVDTSGANPRLSRMLLKAFMGVEPVTHDTAPNVEALRAELLKKA